MTDDALNVLVILMFQYFNVAVYEDDGSDYFVYLLLVSMVSIYDHVVECNDLFRNYVCFFMYYAALIACFFLLFS